MLSNCSIIKKKKKISQSLSPNNFSIYNTETILFPTSHTFYLKKKKQQHKITIYIQYTFMYELKTISTNIIFTTIILCCYP